MDPCGEVLLATGQGVGLTEPIGQYPFAEHTEQFALPLMALYVPATQGTQADPSGPENPGRQVQLVTKLDSAGDEVLAGQLLRMPVQHQVSGGHATHGLLATPW